MAVNYYLESRANKAGELPIRAQVCVKGVTRISTFGISIDPDVWGGSRVTKGTYRNSKKMTGAEINKRLNTIENHFLDWDNQLTHRPTKDEIKEQLDIALERKDLTEPAPVPGWKRHSPSMRCFPPMQAAVPSFAWPSPAASRRRW